MSKRPHPGKNDNSRFQVGAITLNVKSNLVPVCAWCNKVRDNDGNWHYLDLHQLQQHGLCSTHTICEDCTTRYQQEFQLFTPRQSLVPA
jgi:hypothetical protein